MTTPDHFRRIALSLPGTEQGSHFGSVDFRVGGRIFATLPSEVGPHQPEHPLAPRS